MTWDNKVPTQEQDQRTYDNTSEARRSLIVSDDSNKINVQNPLPCDGDSVYTKDIDLENSDNGDFSGSVYDYFNSLHSVNSNSTTDNPKIIKIMFERTIYSHAIGFGCDDLTNGFGDNITIKLLGSGESVRFSKTFTQTDPNSFLAEFGPKAFNGVQIEFNTSDEVCLSNLTISKAFDVNATLHGTDPNGNIQQVLVSKDGYLSIEDNSDGLSISEGNITGKSFIHKFGNAPDFGEGDGEVDIWDGSNDADIAQMTYFYSSIADIDTISSSNSNDTTEIEIIGLNSNYEEITQTITLNGQNKVTLTTPLLRVFRMKNIGSVDLLGNIYIYPDTAITAGVPDDTSNVRAIINNSNNQTEMAIYTVPAGKTGYMRSFYATTAGASKDTNYIIKLKQRPFGQVFQLKHRSSLADNGTSNFNHKYYEPEVIPEKSDVVITAEMTATGATGGSVSAGFDIVLVDN